MRSQTLSLLPDPEDAPEPGAAGEEDLWFLPGAGDDPAGPFAPPVPRAERRALFDAAEWRAAQGALAAELAQVTLRLGRLDERLATMGQGARVRLALREVTDLGWWTGARIGADRLALWLALRAGMAGEDAPALARAGWAARRLSAGPSPSPSSTQGRGQGGWRAGIAGFLGRPVEGAAEEVADAMAGLAGLHPVVEAAVLFHAWRVAASGPSAGLEAAVLAARHAVGSDQGGALFLPLAMAGVQGLAASGSAERRLAAWLSGAERAALSALAELDRLRDWTGRARDGTADLSGRTAPALVEVLARWPAVTAPLAERATGASRAAVQRNLDLFAARELVREITGQGRYRVWTART